MTCTYKLGNLAVAHNGNISNFDRIKAKFVEKGTLFQSSSDTELVLHLIAQSPKTTQIEQILDAMYQLEGAFSLILVTDTAMYAIRDPNGLRPLLLGKMPNQNPQAGSAYFLSSETCAFDLIGAECVREIEPGEILVIKKEHCIEGNFESHRMPPKWGISPCIFEYVYFARPDSRVFGAMVDTVRHECGVQLARESPCPKRGPDDPEIVVVAIPDSSNAAALGFQQECLRMGYPCQFEFGIIRNHYVGRTFITPSQSVRELKVRFKFNMVRRVFEGKIIVLVDDSIVRGTTSRALIRMALKSGAKEVHFRVASPPVVAPCYYGMDFPSKNELIAHHHSNPQSIADWMGAQSLGYLSVEGLQAAVLRCQPSSKDFCKACFTGNYPVPIDGVKNEVLEFVNESTARGPSPIPVIAKKQKTGLSPIPEKIVLPAAIHEAASAAKKAEW
jgi:amidophosphoribosyltransferase